MWEPCDMGLNFKQVRKAKTVHGLLELTFSRSSYWARGKQGKTYPEDTANTNASNIAIGSSPQQINMSFSMVVLCRRTQGIVRKFNIIRRVRGLFKSGTEWKHKDAVGLSQVKICMQKCKQKEPPKREEFVVRHGRAWCLLKQLGYIAAQKSSTQIQESGGQGGLKCKYRAGEVTWEEKALTVPALRP